MCWPLDLGRSTVERAQRKIMEQGIFGRKDDGSGV